MDKKRSVGIIICSVLVIMLGFSYFWLFYVYTQKRSLMTHPPLLILKEVFWLLMSIVYIISAVFLLSLKRWARLLTILITSIYTIDYVFSLGPLILSLINTLIAHKYPNANYNIIWLVLLLNILAVGTLIGIIIYLSRPKVKEQFK